MLLKKPFLDIDRDNVMSLEYKYHKLEMLVV